MIESAFPVSALLIGSVTFAFAARLSPSPTNGSAVKGTLQSTPDVSRLTREDQRLIGEIKQADDKLGAVGNPNNGRPGSQQPGRPDNVTGVQQQGSAASRPLPPPPQTSAVKESTDRGTAQGKPDVARMGEEDQRIIREIIRDTDKVGKVGNPNAGRGRSQPQPGSVAGPGSDLRRDTNGLHLPTNTMGAASGSAC
jgi:hypothetical protein